MKELKEPFVNPDAVEEGISIIIEQTSKKVFVPSENESDAQFSAFLVTIKAMEARKKQ